MLFLFLNYLLIFGYVYGDNGVNDNIIKINANKSLDGYIDHFWSNTGFCPPEPRENISDYLLSDDIRTNIALIGALPNSGITHIRIHWILNLLSNNSNGDFDTTNLTSFLNLLDDHYLYPVVELMGCNNRKVHFRKDEEFWRDLVEKISRKCLALYGGYKFSKFKFETWNEPDVKGYNVLQFNEREYLAYVDGCIEGIHRGRGCLLIPPKLGGPAGLFRNEDHHPLCWSFLKYAADSPYLDYISFHRKGDGSASGVLNGTSTLLDQLLKKHPYLKTYSFANDEADIEANWSKSLEWRADVRYAVMIVKVIAGYYKLTNERKLRIEALSNDNAFLNYHPFYFTQRTLFARFQINTTSPAHSQFIRKPSYTVMALLSYLGDEFIGIPHSDPLLSIMATRCRRPKMLLTFEKLSFISIILAYGNETTTFDGIVKTMNFNISGLWNANWKYIIYRIDNINTNPYLKWKSMGAPSTPNKHQRKLLRQVEEPLILEGPRQLNGTHLTVSVNFTLPSIHLIHICSEPSIKPKKIFSLKVQNVTWNEVLITWKHKNRYSRCLLTFEVELKSICNDGKTAKGNFVRINPSDSIFSSFHHAPHEDNKSCENTRGIYRVRAVDYWYTTGRYSETVRYP